jgi:hypothetical protein
MQVFGVTLDTLGVVLRLIGYCLLFERLFKLTTCVFGCRSAGRRKLQAGKPINADIHIINVNLVLRYSIRVKAGKKIHPKSSDTLVSTSRPRYRHINSRHSSQRGPPCSSVQSGQNTWPATRRRSLPIWDTLRQPPSFPTYVGDMLCTYIQH